jgi:hypothetical protein
MAAIITYTKHRDASDDPKAEGEIHLMVYTENDGVLQAQFTRPEQCVMLPELVKGLGPQIVAAFKASVDGKKGVSAVTIPALKLEKEKAVEP